MPEKLNVKIGDARIGTQPLYLFGGLNRKQPTMLGLTLPYNVHIGFVRTDCIYQLAVGRFGWPTATLLLAPAEG